MPVLFMLTAAFTRDNEREIIAFYDYGVIHFFDYSVIPFTIAMSFTFSIKVSYLLKL